MSSANNEPLHDRLDESFSGTALNALHQLGVHAYNAADLEQNASHVLEEQRTAYEAKRVEYQIEALRKELGKVKKGKQQGDAAELARRISDLENGNTSERVKSKSLFSHDDHAPASVKRVSISIKEKDEDYVTSDSEEDTRTAKRRKTCRVVDDADEFEFHQRLSKVRKGNAEEPSVTNAVLEGGLTVPGRIFDRLFDYQKTALQWLWELHQQSVGGIIGDAMGLGKTITIVSFLAAVANTPSVRLGPTFLLCPASIMGQWLYEFRAWWPSARVMLLHDSGNHECSNKDIIEKACAHGPGHVVITTYESLRKHHAQILSKKWGYVILDEGHRIRNPDATITLLVKRVRTPHRIILSGSPIQNHLRELWSLFDFVFPGRLGTLPVFEEEFCEPIIKGGYIHANHDQVQAAYRCAVLLRDTITPHILRRLKSDVLKNLPSKSEQILFCSLTEDQKLAYKDVLATSNPKQFRYANDLRLFKTISLLRKICNHPDLLMVHENSSSRPSNYGAVSRSGKLKVAEQILKIWHLESQRVLFFSQTRQCLDIIEAMVRENNFEYRRVDGSTAVRSRQAIFDEFNCNPKIFILLLTTRAGGFGLNLTGANRVLVFDPDWNPATDEQAQERAYRIGQTRDVTVLRLVTRGTIEEKVYHRQIFKQLLTNQVLEDPTQQRFFSNSDLKDLFSYVDDEVLETADIFHGIKEAEVKVDTSSNGGSSDLLQCLFNNSDLSSVFSHDKLVSSSSSSQVEKRSAAIAEKAVASLRQSQTQLSGVKVGVPTWTGKSGVAGATSERVDNVVRWLDNANNAISSKHLLAEIKHRQAGSAVPSAIDSKTLQLLHELQDFLANYPEGIDSDKVIFHFQGRISDRNDQHIFRHLLHHVADLKKAGKVRRWVLKAAT